MVKRTKYVLQGAFWGRKKEFLGKNFQLFNYMGNLIKAKLKSFRDEWYVLW